MDDPNSLFLVPLEGTVHADLRDVFTRLPQISTEEQLREPSPDRWITQHPGHRLEYCEKEASQAKERRRQRRALRRQLRRAQAK